LRAVPSDFGFRLSDFLRVSGFGFRISAPPRRRVATPPRRHAAAAQNVFGTRETEPQFLAALDENVRAPKNVSCALVASSRQPLVIGVTVAAW